VVTKWSQTVTLKSGCFPAHEKGPFPRACHSFAASVHGRLLSTHMVSLALDKHKQLHSARIEFHTRSE